MPTSTSFHAEFGILKAQAAPVFEIALDGDATTKHCSIAVMHLFAERVLCGMVQRFCVQAPLHKWLQHVLYTMPTPASLKRLSPCMVLGKVAPMELPIRR